MEKTKVADQIQQMIDKYASDIEYGEIHITLFIRGGKIYRMETQPKISKMIDNE
jgi:hypothetical protein